MTEVSRLTAPPPAVDPAAMPLSTAPPALDPAAVPVGRAPRTVVDPAPGPPRPASRPALLSDRPLEDDSGDLFDYAVYADALAEVIDHPRTDTPLNIAISAPWGAGKTSLARMVEQRLIHWPQQRGELPHVTCWFNAWLHDDAPHLGSALAAEVAKEANRQRPVWRRVTRPLAFAMLTHEERWKRILGLLAASLVAGVALAVAPRAGDLSEPDVVLFRQLFGESAAQWAAAAAIAAILWNRLFSIAQTAARFVREPGSSAAQGSMQTVRAQLGELIAEATRGSRRLVVFVDDLDRCTPAHALEACEAATQLLGRAGVVTVLIGDLDGLAEVVRERYGTGAATEDVGHLYLEKVVQMEFEVPPLDVDAVSLVVQPPRTGEPPPGTRAAVGSATPALRAAARGFRRAARWISRRPVRSAFTLMFLSLLPELTIGPMPDPWSGVIGLTWIAALPVALLINLRRSLQRLQARRNSREVDEVIATQAATSEPDVGLKERVKATHVGRKVSDDLIAQRLQRWLVDESVVRAQAEDKLLEYLPRRPRSAKRLINRLRLHLVIALGRGVVDHGGEVDGTHLGKWIVLIERWRVLADAVARDHSLLADLERAAAEDRPALLAERVPDVTVDADLLRWLDDLPGMAGALSSLSAMTAPVSARLP